jgi:histidinol-phosphate aminotransferase
MPTTLSRRSFAQLIGAGAAAAALPFPQLFAEKKALSKAAETAAGSGGMVRLSANENPYGPSAKALDAMREAFGAACRYPDESQDLLTAEVGRQHGVGPESVMLGCGSSEILKAVAAAFTGRDRKLVLAAPTFEAIGFNAKVTGAEIVNVPLDASYAHDLAAMGAVKDAGVIYVCNPNNPTATITPRNALAAFLTSVPASTVVLVDEAYHHYADSDDYASVIPLVKMHPNLIVARTFSKIYGMAGLRLGYAIAQHELLQKMEEQRQFDSINVMAIAAGRASIADSEHVRLGKERNAATRKTVTDALQSMGYHTLPSQANFIMIDLGREVRPVIAAFKAKDVHVGRLFPAMPKHLRVTIGRPEEMTAFLGAFKSVMA